MVYFGLHLFLFNILARKLRVVSDVHFPIIEVFGMPFELHYSFHLKNRGSYF